MRSEEWKICAAYRYPLAITHHQNNFAQDAGQS